MLVKTPFFLIKVKQRSHENQRMRGLRYTQLNLERLFFPLVLIETLQVLASSCLPQQIFKFSSSLLTRFKKYKLKNSLQLPKPERNTRKMANKFGEIN